MSKRLDQDREKILSHERMLYAKQQILTLGLPVVFESETEIRFIHKNHEVKLFPYSGWHTGKSIKDGRGIHNLLRQLKSK